MNEHFYNGFFDEMEKEALSLTPMAKNLAGGIVGAGAGAAASKRRPGETNQDFARRRALTAAAGGAAGIAGVAGARRGLRALKQRGFNQTRSKASESLGSIAGLGAVGRAFVGDKSQAGKTIKGVENVLQSDAGRRAVSGEGGFLGVVGALGDAAKKNEAGLKGVVKNRAARKKYNKLLSQGVSEGEARKRSGLSGRQSSFGDDVLNLVSGNKVKPAKDRSQRNYDQVKNDAFATLLGGGGSKGKRSRRFLGRGGTTRVTQGGSVVSPAQLERQLNSSIARIQNSDMLTAEQKSKMTRNAIKKFEKRFKVEVSGSGNMAGRSYKDIGVNFAKGIFGAGPQLTVKAKGAGGFSGYVPGVGEKLAHQVLRRHGY